jgi:single-strand DNA-binding protein
VDVVLSAGFFHPRRQVGRVEEEPMNGLYITVDGVVGTQPRRSAWNGSPILSFRFVANERRFDKLRNVWVDGHPSWMTVSCFRELARNVDASIRKGDRLIVHGKVRVKDYVGDDGQQRTTVSIDADSIGHNLIFGTSRFRPTRAIDSAEEQIRAQADELIRELAAEPLEDVGALLAQRAADAESEEFDEDDHVPGEFVMSAATDDEDEEADESEDEEEDDDYDEEEEADEDDEEDGAPDGSAVPALAGARR